MPTSATVYATFLHFPCNCTHALNRYKLFLRIAYITIRHAYRHVHYFRPTQCACCHLSCTTYVLPSIGPKSSAITILFVCRVTPPSCLRPHALYESRTSKGFKSSWWPWPLQTRARLHDNPVVCNSDLSPPGQHRLVSSWWEVFIIRDGPECLRHPASLKWR